ncbi:HPP family protein [Hahella sp. CCB-MM4]|uniref:HPP family protein n=1 Tax=Hahella sp. (strain CCB-MM4) TaxID=1926491 RepID=UPI000B9A65AB|nr:HPP family protein [Hahella sp. CCB-MM4]
MRQWKAQLDGRVKSSILAGIGGAAGIFLLAALSGASNTPLLMAPFGASCVLLFAAPASPFSQPANVIGGHLLSTLIGMLASQVSGPDPWTLAIATALAISLMVLFKIIHPPAGADPMVVLMGHENTLFLLFPVLSGSVVLVLIAMFYHRLSKTASYPYRQA